MTNVYDEVAIRLSNDRLLLESFTPVDSSVLDALETESRDDHLADLVKRLQVTAETVAPGSGARKVREVLATITDGDELLRELDAVLEFGALFAEIEPEDQEKSKRAEIRQEILHFDRIMDLESLTDGRAAVKRRRDFRYQGGLLGAIERLLVLVQERLILRGERPMLWRDTSSYPQRILNHSAQGGTLRRTMDPHLVAVLQGLAEEETVPVLAELEALALRHPLPVALAMTDYSAFLSGTSVGASLAAAAFFRDPSGACIADVWSAGHAEWLIVRRESDFTQSIVASGQLAGTALGDSTSNYGHVQVEIPEGTWLVLATGSTEGFASAEFAAALSRRNSAGRIELVNNLNDLFAGRAFVMGKADKLVNLPAPALSDYTTEIEEFAARAVNDGDQLHFTIECGHIHADREMGPTQLRGLELGAGIVRALRDASVSFSTPLTVEVAPMVDDDHVLNRFSFAAYRRLFEGEGLPVTDLILESSPLARAVAHDVLRRAVQLDGQGYQLRTVGNNLYLEADGLRVELIEDVHGEMRNGCILFEVGLVMYRAAREAITNAYWGVLGENRRDLHGDMCLSYDSSPDPAIRAKIRQDYERMYPDPWSHVAATVTTTPFLDAYNSVMAGRLVDGTVTTVYNVLEDYYRPQQEKVQALARLLRIELPMRSVFFSPYGRGLEFVDLSVTPGK